MVFGWWKKLCASTGISFLLDSICEVEEYQVQLSGVTVLELVINPNIGGGIASASLKNLRLS